MSKRGVDHISKDSVADYGSGIKRNKKACVNCRQQKVRCNATEESKDPCSRCQRMQLTCIISDPFKREHKRQRLLDLERETIELRKRLQQQPNLNINTTSIWENGLPPTPTTIIDSNLANITPSLSHPSTSHPSTSHPSTSHPSTSHPSTSPIMTLNTMVSPPAENHDTTSPTSNTGTSSRAIEGIKISASAIDELFRIFFQNFHMFLPIIDPSCTPNNFYDRSPTLFWSIIGVAARAYPKDSTLLDSLGEKILSLCLSSIRTPTVSAIKGLLMILTWPLSKRAGAHDTAYAISGSIIHMAMQIGLHIPSSSQDFSRVKVCLTQDQIMKRAELWGYCIITYQRCSTFKGHSPLALLETYQDAEQRDALFQRIGPSLRFQLKLNGALTRCSSALLQNGLRIMSKDQELGLGVLVRVFESILKDIEPEAATDLDRFYLHVALLSIQAFVFYKDLAKKSAPFMLTRLYTTASTVLSLIDRMDRQGSIQFSCVPHYFQYATSLSSFCMLRLLKTSASQYLDESDKESAEETFSLGVNIMNRLSLESHDGPSRIALMLTQLWNSEKAFKNPDGTENMMLRIRTRLAMSPVFDSIWWWREEFGGQQGVYTKQVGNVRDEVIVAPSSSSQPFLPSEKGKPDFQMSGFETTHFQDMGNFLDDHLLPELGWTSGQLFYPSMSNGFGEGGIEWCNSTDLSAFAI